MSNAEGQIRQSKGPTDGMRLRERGVMRDSRSGGALREAPTDGMRLPGNRGAEGRRTDQKQVGKQGNEPESARKRPRRPDLSKGESRECISRRQERVEVPRYTAVGLTVIAYEMYLGQILVNIYILWHWVGK